MKKKLLFLYFALFVLIFSLHSEMNAQINKTTGDKNNSSLKNSTPKQDKLEKIIVKSPSKLEIEILEEINLVRTKPAEYAKILEEMRKYYNGKTLTMPGRKGLITQEGITALDEAVNALKKAEALKPMSANCSAVRASRDHLTDLQNSGALSHSGSDGSSPRQRLGNYLDGDFHSAENIIVRTGTARDIVMTILLDDGIANRIHRRNLLNSRYKFAGVSNGDHSKNLNLTIIVFSDSSNDKQPCDMK